MKIWIDADACPGAVREIVIRAAEKLGIPSVFVAAKYLFLPQSPVLSLVLVEAGPDAADAHIVEQSARGDLCVTQDIPLAALLVPKGVVTINPRGDVYSAGNIGERLGMRNFMQDMRDAGLVTGGPAAFGVKDKQRFADSFNRELTKLLRAQG